MVQNRAKNTSNVHRSSHSYAHTIILYVVPWRIPLFCNEDPPIGRGGGSTACFRLKKNKQFLIKKSLFFAEFVGKWQILGHKNSVNCVWAIAVSTQLFSLHPAPSKWEGGLWNCTSEAKILNF